MAKHRPDQDCDFNAAHAAFYRVIGANNEKALLVCKDHITEALLTLGLPGKVERF